MGRQDQFSDFCWVKSHSTASGQAGEKDVRKFKFGLRRTDNAKGSGKNKRGRNSSNLLRHCPSFYMLCWHGGGEKGKKERRSLVLLEIIKLRGRGQDVQIKGAEINVVVGHVLVHFCDHEKNLKIAFVPANTPVRPTSLWKTNEGWR